MTTHRLSMSTADLDAISRIADAQRVAKEIAASLLNDRTSKKESREDFGRRLNGLAASLKTVEMYLTDREIS